MKIYNSCGSGGCNWAGEPRLIYERNHPSGQRFEVSGNPYAKHKKDRSRRSVYR